MANIKLEFTPAQFSAMLNICGDIEAMIGGGGDETENDFDEMNEKRLKLIKRMLLKNGYENPFNTI